MLSERLAGAHGKKKRGSWDAGELLGGLHLPLYLGGVGVIFGDHQLMGWDGGAVGASFFSQLPQYGGWIGNRRAVRDALGL